MLLALDTSSDYVSLALFDDLKLLAYDHQAMTTGQAEALFPMLQKLLKKTKLKPNDISCIAVAIGPGSFTGVRIGLATARAFVLALNIPIIGITNFDVAAYDTKQPVTAVLDTKRGDFFVQKFNKNGKATSQPIIQTSEQLAKSKPFVATGSGALSLSKDIGCTCISATVVPAVAIGYLALTRPELHHPVTPLYLREANVTV
ncbi:MAG: tRNA (adenosine(37)-N6)-threonylcarbamoyltransferase complex dimerization subunit type 1 TsaB [Alphaproteobacteria bacterium]|nr:tRNA (adenosine(37)-N6)-threonylcarbamoyltransferase complex dimerization subunit type 1 TsaB [Alphaproteobacteria bacterium]